MSESQVLTDGACRSEPFLFMASNNSMREILVFLTPSKRIAARILSNTNHLFPTTHSRR